LIDAGGHPLESLEESADKVMSGGDAKACPGCEAENLKDLKAQEGIEAQSDVKPLSRLTDRRLEKSSEG
jgi:hypothetical protein